MVGRSGELPRSVASVSNHMSSSPHRCSPAELEEFETRMNVRLPDAYKRYLMDTGAGELTSSRVSLLEDWCQPYDEAALSPTFLSEEFPYREAWNDLRLIDEDKGWRSPYYDPALFRGSMRIVNIGCEGYYLLVVTGEERGNVWVDDRARTAAGIYPLQRPGRERVRIDDYLRADGWDTR